MSETLYTYIVVVKGGVVAQGTDGGQLNQTIILTAVNTSTQL